MFPSVSLTKPNNRVPPLLCSSECYSMELLTQYQSHWREGMKYYKWYRSLRIRRKQLSKSFKNCPDNWAIVLGRAFTRRMYAKFSGTNVKMTSTGGTLLKPYHHIKLDNEFRLDCKMWECFLLDINAVVRPFIDLDTTLHAEQINFYSDASAAKNLGYGVIFQDNWLFGQ